MDSVEDWVGKIKLEAVSLDSSSASKIRFGSQFQSAKDTTPLAKSEDKNLPKSWVEDVGVGNERDKVVGYWRFSDSISPGDPDFISNNNYDFTERPPAPAVLNFIDLSKFCTILELIADKDNDLEPILPVLVEPTTSSVDPGEDPEKVKTSNDIIFPPQDEGFRSPAIRTGLRTVVGRGSPLDIGIYHEESERRRITIELMICRVEEPVVTKKPGSQVAVRAFKQFLALRTFGVPTG
jgi:hypothetical protein